MNAALPNRHSLRQIFFDRFIKTICWNRIRAKDSLSRHHQKWNWKFFQKLKIIVCTSNLDSVFWIIASNSMELLADFKMKNLVLLYFEKCTDKKSVSQIFCQNEFISLLLTWIEQYLNSYDHCSIVDRNMFFFYLFSIQKTNNSSFF